MKWLKAILETQGIESEQITSIVTEAEKQKLIPKERFDAVNTQLKEANSQLTNVNSELETLKNSAQSSEVLKQQIADLQKKHTDSVTEYEGKIKEMKIHDFVKGEITKELKDPKYFDLLYKEVDHSKLVLAEDGSVAGFDIAPFKEKYTDLFGEVEGGLGSFGNPPRKNPDGKTESLGESLAKMTLANTVESKQNPYF